MAEDQLLIFLENNVGLVFLGFFSIILLFCFLAYNQSGWAKLSRKYKSRINEATELQKTVIVLNDASFKPGYIGHDEKGLYLKFLVFPKLFIPWNKMSQMYSLEKKFLGMGIKQYAVDLKIDSNDYIQLTFANKAHAEGILNKKYLELEN